MRLGIWVLIACLALGISAHAGVEDASCVKLFSIKKKIERFTRPVTGLDEHSSMEEIAKAAADFKREVDRWYGTGCSAEQLGHMSVDTLQERGFSCDYATFEPLIHQIKRRGRAPKKQPLQNELSNAQAIGFVRIFCGLLLQEVPTKVTQGIGITLVHLGVESFA